MGQATTVTAILDEWIQVLEAAAYPANPNNPKNIRLENNLKATLSNYFLALGRAFPYAAMDAIYNDYVQESVYSVTTDRYAPVLAAFDDQIKADIEGHMRTIYLSGSADMMQWGQTNLGKPILFEGPPWDDAIKYADQYGGALVTQMDEETRRRIGRIVSDGIANKRGIPGLKRDIRAAFQDMSNRRARLIAQTEANNSLSQAFLDQSRKLGVTGKSWIVFHPCPICQANADAQAIGLEDTFPSGHKRPTAHPDCKCTLAPVMLEDEKAVKSKISEFGEQYKSSSTEHAISLNRNGDQIFSKTGDSNSITFTAQDMADMKGTDVFVHNHPRSTSFSIDDILHAEKIDARSIVVTSELNKYTMRPVGPWQTEKVRKLFAAEQARLFPKAKEIYYKSGQDAADSWLFHNTWENIKDKINYIYTKETT